MKVKNAVALVFLLFLMIRTELVLGQEEQVLTDSTSFVEFLKSQGKIPGLNFRLVDSSTQLALDSTVTNSFTYRAIADYTTAIDLKNRLLQSDSITAEIQFLIYEEPNTFDAAQEYVSILLRNGDLEPVTVDNSSSRDLVSLASKERYSPLPSGAYTYFRDFKVFSVILIITLFFAFAFSMILFMLIFKARRNRKEILLVTYDEEIVAPLSEILFEKSLEELEALSDEELYRNFPAKQLKKPIYRKVLIERIIALNKNMKGDFKLKLKALYKRLELDKVTISKLNSPKWHNVVTGLVEVNEMDLIEALREVKKHVNSPNFHIRSQAVATVLNLSGNADLSFLRDQTFPLSRWQQMNYLRIIKYLHASRDLHIENLFDSSNQSIRLFGYKLVCVIGRVDLLADLEQKFYSVTVEEKIEIIKTFEYLGVPAHTELINESLKSEDIELVTIAAKAVGVIGDEQSVHIICELLKAEPNFKLQMTLLKSLQSLDSTLYKQVIQESTNLDVQRINLHLIDPILQDV